MNRQGLILIADPRIVLEHVGEIIGDVVGRLVDHLGLPSACLITSFTNPSSSRSVTIS
jgi:hypothetical protein